MWNLKVFTDIYVRFRESGLTVRDFCQNECINEAKFYYWQKRLKSQESFRDNPSGFVPLVIHPGTPIKRDVSYPPRSPIVASSSAYEIIYPNGVTLRLPVSTDFGLLQSFIFLSE